MTLFEYLDPAMPEAGWLLFLFESKSGRDRLLGTHLREMANKEKEKTEKRQVESGWV